MNAEVPKRYASSDEKNMQDRFRANHVPEKLKSQSATPPEHAPAVQPTLEQQVARSIADLADDFRP